MRITESGLRRIIRSVILEQAHIDKLKFNQLCQNYYKDPYEDPEDPEPNTNIDNYDYYKKIHYIFEKGGNLTDALEERLIYYDIRELMNHRDAESFCIELQKLLVAPHRDDLNELLSFVIDMSA